MSHHELRQKLAAETGIIHWDELQRHFARGAVIVVAPDLELVEVAARLAEDDSTALREWLATGRVTRATDEHARAWTASRQEFRAVVVAPWVLVQNARTQASH